MTSKSQMLLLAAGLLAVPLGAAVAQPNPAGNLGSNRSATASPGTADSSSESGMHTGDVGSQRTATGNYGGPATSSTTPGATGRTIVPGSNSSQASAAEGTAEQKTGTQAAGGSK